jgi:hypothetical protein
MIPRFTFRYCVLIISSIIFICLNTASLAKEIARMRQVRVQLPYIFMGHKFSGLDNILKDSTHIGYFTDKDMNDRLNALQFAQAQYILTPVILERNNTDHAYILFDCEDEQNALKKMKELGAVPLRKNRFGIILAHNPNHSLKE